MIDVEKLTKRYGDFTAIEDVTFKVDEGEVVGFLGPNAAGKTTTMRILTCFMPATGGTAQVAGYDVFRDSIEVRKRIGYMPENVPLYTEMTVSSYLHFMAKIRGVPSRERGKRVDEVIDACGLEDYRNKTTGKLSKGYRQRVGLAQALVHNPPVLILDEPTIGLDPRQIIEIRNLIKGLRGEHTVILSTHILPEASMICNRIIIIKNGRIAGSLTLKDGKVRIIESQVVGKTNMVGSGGLYVKVRGPSDKVISNLSLTNNVEDAKLENEEDGIGTYLVTYKADMDIRSEISSMIIHSGWGLLELRPAEMTLEAAFLYLTQEEVASE